MAALSPKDLTNLVEQISGSAAFRKEYEELEAKKADADEKTSFVFSKKKAVMAEKKLKKEQKEEAEKHIRMQQDLVRMRALMRTLDRPHVQVDKASSSCPYAFY